MTTTRKIRLILTLLILAFSIALLFWGILPLGHETQILPIPPSDLQLPTPEGALPGIELWI